ncbi:fungal specific transcription factor domain-containing protein [Aspergillus tanneri]|nr:uncharacterized protein ATNIH1004_006368 [Aspergillus tanneri]KAA8647674.1 hypothetical protein ATNIH1004_006368 [Aspergillus tanneri]
MCSIRGDADKCVYQQSVAGKHKAALARSQYDLSPGPGPGMPGDNSARYSCDAVLRSGFNGTHLPRAVKSDSLETVRGTGETSHHIRPTENPRPERASFGPSSTLFFIQQIAAAVEPVGGMRRDGSPTLTSSLNQKTVPDAIGFSVSAKEEEPYDSETLSLPEKQLSDSLLEAYWQYLHPIFPVLHRPTFMKQYHKLWQPEIASLPFRKNTNSDIVFLAVVNMVLAVGCQQCYDFSAERRQKDAEALYKRSFRLVSIETLDFYSLEVVQLFLLRAIFLQSTSHSARCWSMLGVVVRAAQGLRLNTDTVETNQLEREMRHDEYLSESEEGHQPENIPSRLAFFNHYITLCDISRDIMDRLNAVGGNSSEQNGITALTQYLSEMPKLCLRLDEFLGGLPSHLENHVYGIHGLLEDCFHMQGQILRTRALYIRVTILRPCLLATIRYPIIGQEACKDAAIPGLLSNLTKDTNKLCVSTACTVLRELRQNLRLIYRSSTWHTLRLTFGSATVLLAASLIPDMDINLNQEPIKTSWDHATDIFEFYKSQEASAQHGLRALRDYRRRFEAVRLRGQHHQQPQSIQPEIMPSSSVNTLPGIEDNWLASAVPNIDFTSQNMHDWDWLDPELPNWMLL